MAKDVLRILGDEQQEQIDAAVMRILSEIGLEVAGPEIREILVGAGCLCEGRQVRFPVSLVRESIDAAPKTFEMRGLEAEPWTTWGTSWRSAMRWNTTTCCTAGR